MDQLHTQMKQSRGSHRWTPTHDVMAGAMIVVCRCLTPKCNAVKAHCPENDSRAFRNMNLSLLLNVHLTQKASQMGFGHWTKATRKYTWPMVSPIRRGPKTQGPRNQMISLQFLFFFFTGNLNQMISLHTDILWYTWFFISISRDKK